MGRILSAPALAATLAPWVIGTTLAAGLGAIALLRFRGFSAIWAPGIALLAGTVSLVVVGDSLTLRAMCAEAAGHEASSFQRNSFSWSLRHPRRAFNFEVHALSDHEGTRRIWSYRDMAWVVLPPGVAGNIDPPRQQVACAASR
ncbi:hypothetical protein KUV47_01235 [Vannielia litorea]|uniref:hypothetical protein n=1 Tax=Vannielia litorea TaxID=1217970 RepID=UPI001C96F339|nr:hypothetical protein [Vannielia litorea]MBY6151820.1 hypothetical protein [Vannielia litorea]